MNKTELVKLYKALKLLGEVKGSAKFSYGIVKNQKIISDKIRHLHIYRINYGNFYIYRNNFGYFRLYRKLFGIITKS